MNVLQYFKFWLSCVALLWAFFLACRRSSKLRKFDCTCLRSCCLERKLSPRLHFSRHLVLSSSSHSSTLLEAKYSAFSALSTACRWQIKVYITLLLFIIQIIKPKATICKSFHWYVFVDQLVISIKIVDHLIHISSKTMNSVLRLIISAK